MSQPEPDAVEVARSYFEDCGVVKETREANGENRLVLVTNEHGFSFGNIIKDFDWDIQIWETWIEIKAEPYLAHTIEVKDGN